MNTFKDQVVLITGAGKGRGRILAEAFAARGAQIAANDISPINVDELVSSIVANGGRARVYVEDVAKKVGAQMIIKQVEDDFGHIDVLINHAAVQPHDALLDMDEWDWHRVLDVNLTGAFLMTQSVGRVMRARGKGVIINLVAGSAHVENPTEQEFRQRGAAFVASMSGMQGLTQEAARELRPYGIRVYAVDDAAGPVVERVFALLEES